MTRTTPPRPFNLDTIPGLAGHRGTTTRLHPRTGSPTTADSSIGGPLLWPAAEPWPMCTEGEEHFADVIQSPAAVRRSRKIRAAPTGRPLTPEERAELTLLDASEPEALIHRPVPLIPVAQLYRRDVPDFLGPGDTDLFQLLWCPLGHEDDDAPAIRVFWRRTAEIGPPLTTAPEAPAVEEFYLPNRCVVHPEQVVDYRYEEVLPADLRARILAWEKANPGASYGRSAVVPGWKMGGFPTWRMTGPGSMNCQICDHEMVLVFTVGYGEWDESGGWRPIEDPADFRDPLTEVLIGRGFDWHIFLCPASFDHPIATVMQ
jgi:hypothetical protein